MTSHAHFDGDFDYIVVGAGSAGCVVANRLSADPRRRVLLIEAGGEDRWIWFHIPAGYIYAIGNPRADWMYRTEPEPQLQGRSLRYPRGKVVGGSSAINAMIAMRGQRADYDAWAAMGLTGWAADEVFASFRRLEDHFLGPSDQHGISGEWRIEAPRVHWTILDRIAEAAQQMGVPATRDFNTGDNEGVGLFHVNQKRGRRWSAARGFLKPARHRSNLRLETKVTVERLLLEGQRVVGAMCRRGAERIEARARGEVILCAGSIGSAQILQISGIGPADWLRDVGIEPTCDRPGLGRNLQDHLQQRAVFAVKGATTLNELYHRWSGRAWIGLQYAVLRRGPLTMAPSQLGLFTRSSPDQARPNIEFHIQPLSLDAFGEPLHQRPAVTVAACNLRPTSRGTVRLRSPDPVDPPLIAPNYLTTPDDQSIAADALRLTRRLMAQPALAPHEPQELTPGPRYGNDDASLVEAVGAIGTTIFHPVGTSKMGLPQDPYAVVDARLRFIGLAGLRIIDASIMPTIVSGNTNTPVIMIADKGARFVIEDNI